MLFLAFVISDSFTAWRAEQGTDEKWNVSFLSANLKPFCIDMCVFVRASASVSLPEFLEAAECVFSSEKRILKIAKCFKFMKTRIAFRYLFVTGRYSLTNLTQI